MKINVSIKKSLLFVLYAVNYSSYEEILNQ